MTEESERNVKQKYKNAEDVTDSWLLKLSVGISKLATFRYTLALLVVSVIVLIVLLVWIL